ncbi:hemolysin family protein [Promicromonospora sukumoe]|uniref:CBS domain containing-hemolysin-like protein n=1 Tax=Promicromonospora sukumoe TaxID=88382 RepID=A0A7W3JB57_9MICO|nr:hemolysin family protein [Promicromonospora sukumoe]MBA8809539.1 CBS domain containing-hemolysin-like protein [Promicromonospora sukumoe]
MTWVISLLLGVVVILAITAVTGYFVAQEFAYMAVDRARLAARSEAGDAGARRALGVTRRTSFMLSGAQLGITVTGLLVGYVAEPLVGEALGEALGGVGVPMGTGVAIGTIFALVLSTLVQMLFGELVPKNLAIARPEPVALWLARSTTIYLAVFGWLIKVFDAASNALLRLLRIEPVHDVEHSATARDLEHIVADSRASGDLPGDLSVLLDRILDFPRQDVEHAMIPRARVGVVHSKDTLAQVRELMAAGHSRYPVVDDDGEVTGVVHLTDLLAAPSSETTVAELLRPALVLPTSMALPDALRELSSTRNQMACVVDEYGGFAGVLTVEDLAEELVGEITDEHDDEIDPVTAASDGVWVMAGDVHLDEVERAVERDLPEGDHETIAGLAIAVHGSLPAAGDVVDVALPTDPATLVASEPPPAEVLRIEVLDVERHVPSHVRVTVVEAPPEDEAETPAGHHAGSANEETR